MITTADLQALTAPLLAEVFAALGHDLEVVTPIAGGTWNAPSAGHPAGVPVRGLLMPASAGRRQTAAGAGLPVPSYEAYLPFGTLGLDTPGWFLTHQGQTYHPLSDAEDPGGQGLVWIVELGAPGEVNAGGDTQPDWTLPPP